MLTRGKLDAIVYRIGGVNPCYVSEHDCSRAKDKDFYRSLSRLGSRIRSDLSSGHYSPGPFDYIRPFATCVDTVLPLRDGLLKQFFFGCSYEALDGKGRHGFVSSCPTNHSSCEADALLGSFQALGEIIEARYRGECVNDLLRELPRAPLVTTFRLDVEEGSGEVDAIIERNSGSFEAFCPGLPFRARADEPYKALTGLERMLSNDPAQARGHLLHSAPIFGPVDVQLSLKESYSAKRFLTSIVPGKNGTRYYHVYAPQAGVATKSVTIEGALRDIKEAIAVKFQNSPLKDVERALQTRPILTTARLN